MKVSEKQRKNVFKSLKHRFQSKRVELLGIASSVCSLGCENERMNDNWKRLLDYKIRANTVIIILEFSTLL